MCFLSDIYQMLWRGWDLKYIFTDEAGFLLISSPVHFVKHSALTTFLDHLCFL